MCCKIDKDFDSFCVFLLYCYVTILVLDLVWCCLIQTQNDSKNASGSQSSSGKHIIMLCTMYVTKSLYTIVGYCLAFPSDVLQCFNLRKENCCACAVNNVFVLPLLCARDSLIFLKCAQFLSALFIILVSLISARCRHTWPLFLYDFS